MTQEPRRPLHRLTPLRDDPAATWLTRQQRVRVAMTTVFGWIGFSIFLKLIWWAQVLLIFGVFGTMAFDARLPTLFTAMAGIALVWPARRIILRRRSAKMAELVREGSPDLAVAVDDFSELERQPDGTIVSIVGWIHARGQLAEKVEGEPCIGIALACHQKYPGVLETLNDFDVVDEAGHKLLVQVTGGRMLGASNVNLTDGKGRKLLIASLDLPVGAVATGWDAFVLRDGDPVMIVGFKQTVLDPTQASLRSPSARASVASLPPKPLLIFPIAAERRPQAAAGLFNLS